MDDLIELATPDFLSAAAAWGNPSQAPVFIVGMPRSGTSLVEQIAASHSRVFGAGELHALGEIWDTLSRHNRGRPVEKWDAAFARRLADRHVAALQALGNGAVRIIDKMPDNIFFLWLIAALFPSARIILCRRDLRDVCLSCYFHHFTEGHLYAYDLADCGARALEIDRLATHWSRVLPLEILAIDYEKLVSDPRRREPPSHRVPRPRMGTGLSRLSSHRAVGPDRQRLASSPTALPPLDRTLAPLCTASEHTAGGVGTERSDGVGVPSIAHRRISLQ